MKVKQIIAAALAATILIGIFPISASASDWGAGDTLEDALSELKVGFDDTLLDWLMLPSLGVIKLRYAYFQYKNERTGTIDEHAVYCIDPTKGGAYEIVADVGPNSDGSNTATYIRGEKVGDAKYKAIMAAGFPHMSLAGLGLQTRDEAYYATKLALWMYIRGNDPTKLTINPKYGDSDPTALRVRNAAVNIYEAGTKASGTRAPKLTLTGKPSATAKLDASGEYYVQGVEVYASGWVGTNPDACGDVQLSWASPPPTGTIVLGSDGEDITASLSVKMRQNNGYIGNVTIKYPAAVIDPETFYPPMLNATVIVPNDGIYLAYAQVNKDKYQRYLVESDPKAIVIASFASQVSIDEPGKDFPSDTGLRIRKLETGTLTPLAGAVFEICDPDGKLIYSMATDASGIIDIPLYVVGNYTVTEISPPEYHLLSEPRTQSVYVRYGEAAEVTFTNAPYGTLRVVKRDASNGAPLGGAAVRIRNILTNATQEMRTDSSGCAVFDKLPVGAYEIVEVTAPDGYALDTTIHTINVLPLSEGETSYTLVNKANPGLRVIKFDRQKMTPIEGVAFEVWRDGELYGTYTTDAWGEIELRDIPAGTYLAREIAAPEPYVLDPTAQWVEIKAGQGYISELMFFNLEKPGIRLVKVDSETLAPLPIARYEVKKVGDSFANEYVTDINGEIDLAGLEPGAYTVKELAAPNGYLIDDAVRVVQVNAGENAQFVFTNTKKPCIEIVKYDPIQNKYLGGATFRIAKISDGTNYLDRITDTNGRIYTDNLEPGVYSVQEVAAPGGYILNEREYHIELFPGRTSTVVVENVKKPSLIVWKYDEQTAAPLPDTEFSIAKKGGTIIHEGVTNGSGFIRLDNLDVGWYTVTELAPPPGYLPGNPASKDVYLEPGKTTQIKFDNLRCPTLTIIKLDSVTHGPIANVKFNVTFAPDVNFSGGVVNLGNYTTDESGRILLDSSLKAGWYRVTEIEAAAGYIMKEPITQEIFLRGGEDKTLTFENIPKSAVIIRKIDSATGLPVNGATFEVRYLAGTSGSGGTLIKTIVTAENGTATLTGLAPGTYVVTETRSAPGHQLANPATQTAYISDGEQSVVELVFSNPKMGKLVITKLDSVTKQPIAGVTFLVTDSSGAVIGPNNGEYTTDKSGVIEISEWLPIGSTVNVKEIRCPDTHNMDAAPQSVKIAENTTHRLTFYDSPKSGLQIVKIDSTTKQPLKGAQFTVYKLSGEVLGTYDTNADGVIIISKLEPGWYKIIETRSPDGYILDDTPKDVEITNNQFVRVVFENTPIGGLQIIKLDEDTRQPISGVEFEISRISGERVGTYRTDSRGIITLPLNAGWYVVVERSVKSPYKLDATPRNVEVKDGKTTTLEITNKMQASILLRKIDSVTGAGIYGVTFLLSDANRNPVGEYISDQEGYVWLDGILDDGKYFIKEIKPAPGYLNDDEVKTIYVTAGKCTEIIWKNTAAKGQIIVTKLSSEYNAITNLPECSPLAGAVFEVRTLAGNLVERITSDSRGIAATRPLAPGVYVLTEVSPPPFYTGTDKELIAQIKHDGDIVRFTVYNKSVSIGVTVDKKGNTQVQCGQSMRYDLYNVGNTSSVPLESFYLHDRLPTDAVRIAKLYSGTWNQRLNYSIYFKTNYRDYRVLASGLQSHINYELSLHPNVLGLMAGEYVTDIRWEFGTVNAGFKETQNPFMYVDVLNFLPKDYTIVNRADTGGRHGNEWQTARTTWITTIFGGQTPPKLPQAGY